MSVDFEAIAQRGRCDVSSLRLAEPLLRQGYTPPFLSRYRRDELGGIDEASLWALSAAIKSDQDIQARRERLQEAWQETPLADPAIGRAIDKAATLRVLSRLARRLKGESGTTPADSDRLAVRLLNPSKGDAADPSQLASAVEGITDVSGAVAGLDDSLARRLAGDPRIIAAAVRWLSRNAKVKIAKIHDPHVSGEESGEGTGQAKQATPQQVQQMPDADGQPADAENDSAQPPPAATTTGSQPVAGESTATEPTATEPTSTQPAEVTVAFDIEPASASEPTAQPVAELAQPNADVDAATTDSPPADAAPAETTTLAEAEQEPPAAKSDSDQPQPAKSETKKSKKVSPRQRRRRWLVSVLKPLQGKSFNGDKLSAFQLVMLGRALRSQVAVCAFEYDAARLVGELQSAVGNINKPCAEKLKQILIENESAIREAAESAWWDDLQEKASARLVNVTGDTLRKQVNRGAVDAKIVLSIDAVGPRTAAATIVSSDGRLLHSEDLPCQLSATQRSATVLRMGELIHAHHIDLIVISNGPARRAIMVALSDLIKQSPEKSVRWTLAERGGADAYSSSPIADQEMRSTPRRFRAAAWLAFSVLQPAQAMAKVDPLKLRLSSFQRELSDEALAKVLEDIMISGASRGGVDVNSAPASWLRRLPGMNESVATAIEKQRREELFTSRDGLLALDGWTSEVESRQSLPFLRVFGSEESLDGTLIHPGDYPLAKKLAGALKIELPPPTPPGYEAPDYSAVTAEPSEAPAIEVPQTEQTPIVEEFSAPGENATEFAIDSESLAESTPQADAEQPELQQPETDQAETAVQTESPSGPAAESDSDSAPDSSEPSGSSDPQPGQPQPSETQPSETEPSNTGDSVAEEAVVASDESATAAEESTAPPAVDVAQPIKHPLPEKAAIEKCVKEWQIGKRRTHQIVHWLCDPFGDSDATGAPPAVLTKIPALKELKPGDQVIGVVVSVMPFGIFVELAPDCSGLIHVSRASDSFVEDLHEAVQVGDVVTAWVTGTEEKKRRVGLSALSPERESELAEQRRSAADRKRGGGYRGRGDRNQRNRNQSRGGGHGGGQGSGQGRGGRPQGSDASGGSRGGDGKNRRGQGGGDRGGRGGKGRDSRGGGGRDRRGGAGRQREKKPESYRVVGKAEEKKITEAMQQGKEPLRSFGDLAQFLGTGKSETKQVKEPQAVQDNVVEQEQAPPPEASVAPTAPQSSLPESGSSAPPTVDPKPDQPQTDTQDASEGEASGA